MPDTGAGLDGLTAGEGPDKGLKPSLTYAAGSLTAEHRAYVRAALADPERAVRAHLEHSTRAIIDGRRSAT